MATNFILKPFRFNLSDLNFIQDQINFRPLFDAAGNAIIAWDGTGQIYKTSQGAALAGNEYDTTGMSAADAIAAYGTSYASVTAAQGLRNVSGIDNNLHLVNHLWGSVDQAFLRNSTPSFDNYIKPTTTGFYGSKAFGTPTVGNTDYTKQNDNPNTIGVDEYAPDQSVIDYTPRMISKTITTGGATPLLDGNGQVVHWDPVRYANDPNYAALFNAQSNANAQVAADLIILNQANAAKAAAISAQATASANAAAAAATEAAKLAARDAAAADLPVKQAAEAQALLDKDAALAAYGAQFTAVVVPLMQAEAAALAARNAVDPLTDPVTWAQLDQIYQDAQDATAAGQLSIQPFLNAVISTNNAYVAAQGATAAAVTAVATTLAEYGQAVIDSDAADAALATADGNVTSTTAAAATAQATYDADVTAAANAHADVPTAGLIPGAAVVTDYGILAGGQHDPQDPSNGEMFFGAINPGVAPGNSFLAYFGQFFDHGLDFVSKGASGTKIYIPLATDDPLYRAPDPNIPGDQGNTRIVVSRADVSGFDANGNAEWANHTSPYIDQSQTYGSNSNITELLREWVSTDGGATYHAGAHLFDGATSVTWTNAWGEATQATLPTLNELRAHLVATGRDDLSWADVLDLRARDATGHVIDGDAGTAGVQGIKTGQALLLDMNPHFDTSHFSQATIDALAAIGITAGTDGKYALGGPGSLGTIINFQTFEPMSSTASDPLNALAQEVLLESVGDHYIAGDGRANENIGLTAIHHVFHEEHNFQVRNIQQAIQAQDARAVALGDTSHTIAHDWQVATATTDANGNYTYGVGGPIAWNEAKLFDAAKLTVEMEYQHAAVDQYARTITPDIPEFVGYNSGENATVSLEYAQGAFRFGHSTMRETIDMLDPNGSITGKVMSVALEQAFLNPALFAQKGAASIAMGLTHQQMNEIDELLTPAMNQGLLGQPLDLAAINIARGRDIGLPTLNDFREEVGLTRYTSWADFGAHMVHPESLVNFIAAYSFDGDIAKAKAIVDAEAGDTAALEALLGVDTTAALDYAINFLNGDAAIAGSDGFNHIDTWIGGLAEVHVMGGLLGETFNLVFVDQIQRLMDGDRFYYLFRLNNLNLGDEIANAQLKDIVERNTGLEHLNGSVFAYADQYVDLSAKVDTVNTTDTGDFKKDHKYGQLLEDRATALAPAIGVYTTSGSSTSTNGTIVTVGGVQYIRDIRAAGGNPNNPNINGENLDGTPDTGANSNEVLIGTDNKDLIYMWAGDDTAYGEGGNDTIYGDAGIDRLYGGDGNDTIYGGDSGDLIDGGAGDDKLYGESSGTAAAGLDQVIGGDGNDIIYGGIGIDKLSGGAGDDVIYGGGDTDAFTHGGDGNDYIDGGSDGDLLWGDGGDDLIVGGDNQDIVAGLDGDDILRPGNPSSAMGGGPDEVLGGDGASDAGNDGKGTGFDMIDFSDYVAATNGVNADFVTQANPLVAIDGTNPFPAWVGIEGLIGSRNNDTVLADANSNWLIGGSGNDTMTGGGGFDLIIGDGVRLDSLIGTYSGGYAGTFDGASHRATGFIGSNGLLDVAGPGFEKHYTEMLKSEIFKDLELGSGTVRTLIGGGTTGDGGTAGSDTVVFTGNRADYTVQTITFAPTNEATITAYKITDNVAGRDATDLVFGVENFTFADGTVTAANLINIAPVITSDGGGATAAITVPENGAAVTTVTATEFNNVPGDPLNGQVLTFSIAGGADAGKFTIDPLTGVLAFLEAQNFEMPADADANNVYDVVVKVSDGISFDTQALAVTVQNLDEAGSGALNVGYTVNGANTSVTLAADGAFNDPDLVSDANPLGTANISYQWQQSANNGATWTNIAGAAGTAANLTPSGAIANSIDRPLHVIATYTDAFGAQSTTSSAFEIGNNNGNTLNGTAGADTLIGLGGGDLYVVNHTGDVVVEAAGAGTDTIQTSLGSYTLAANFENLQYSNGNGTADDESFVGTGNSSNNTLRGGGAADILTGGSGNDALFGSGGTDIAVFAGSINSATFGLAGNSVQVTTALDGTDTLTSMEKVRFAGIDLTLRIGSNNDNNNFVTQIAPELFLGFDGTDTVVYLSNMQVNASLASGTATNGDRYYSIENLTGGTGNDTLVGNTSANVLSGGDGNDRLTGGGGNDTLIGGNGFDTIVFAPGFGNDTVNGFDSDAGGGGQDKLDVSGFTGANNITAANYLSFMTITGVGTTTIVIDNDGNAGNGVLGRITLNGVNAATIDQTDFVF